MDEIEVGTLPVGLKMRAECLQWELALEALQAGQREDGIVEVRVSRPVAPGPLGAQTGAEELADQRGGFAEKFGGQTCHL